MRPGAPPASALPAGVRDALQRFVARSRFATHGGVVTDLDGTAVHKVDERTIIASAVEQGLMSLAGRGRPVVINSLRFPLSIIHAFGRDWYRVTGAPIPTVALNGSLVGRLVADRSDTLAFDEIEAFPVGADDIDELLDGVRGLVDAAVDEIVLLYYPRDWTKGEIAWTPSAERVAAVAQKYVSASEVVASPVEALSQRLHAADVCMMSLQVDVPGDRRLAFQHTKRGSFVTRAGVDKLFGARAIARHVAIDLGDSIGAGDAELDTFLCAVGMAIVVGNAELHFKGAIETVRLSDALALGALLGELGLLIDAPATPRAAGGAP